MATDEGFFGPSSVSWRIHRDASAILGAGRALLVQALEPHIMEVFLKNTDYRDDPWGRLRRTGDYFGDVICGDTARAVAAGAKVSCPDNRLVGHRGRRDCDPSPRRPGDLRAAVVPAHQPAAPGGGLRRRAALQYLEPGAAPGGERRRRSGINLGGWRSVWRTG